MSPHTHTFYVLLDVLIEVVLIEAGPLKFMTIAKSFFSFSYPTASRSAIGRCCHQSHIASCLPIPAHPSICKPRPSLRPSAPPILPPVSPAHPSIRKPRPSLHLSAPPIPQRVRTAHPFIRHTGQSLNPSAPSIPSAPPIPPNRQPLPSPPPSAPPIPASISADPSLNPSAPPPASRPAQHAPCASRIIPPE